MFTVEIFGTFIVGIGLCFAGLDIFVNSVRKIASPLFRTYAVSHSKSPMHESLCGGLLSLLLGNVTNVTFMTSSLVSSNTLPASAALPIITWAFPGAALMMLLGAINIQLSIFYLIGIAGIIFAINTQVSLKQLIEPIVGIGLILFSINVIQSEALALKKYDWIHSTLLYWREQYFLIMLFGLVMRALIRPSLVLYLFFAALLHSHYFTLEQGFAFCLGVTLTASFISALKQLDLRPIPKEMMQYSILFRWISAAIFILTLCFELFLDLPFILSFIKAVTSNRPLQLTLAILFTNSLTAIIIFPFINSLHKMLQKRQPQEEGEEEGDNASQLTYIEEVIQHDSESALDLLDQEQIQQLEILAKYVASLREQDKTGTPPDLESIHKPYNELEDEIKPLLTKLSEKDLAQNTFERYLNYLHRYNTVEALEKNIFLLTGTISELLRSQNARPLVHKFVEAIDIILMMAVEANQSLEKDDLNLLNTATSDKQDVMKEVRAHYFSKESEMFLNPQEKQKFLDLIVYFERSIWLFHQLSELLSETKKFKLK